MLRSALGLTEQGMRNFKRGVFFCTLANLMLFAPIVVLDEATAFADPENEALIQRALAHLTRGKTVLMIAHRLSTVVGADKICVLADGRLVEEGAHDELAAAGGVYARMWEDYRRAAAWRIGKAEGGGHAA